MLKWTSESEYFLSFENFFADTIYHIIQSKSNHFTPSAAHARRGVKRGKPSTDQTYGGGRGLTRKALRETQQPGRPTSRLKR